MTKPIRQIPIGAAASRLLLQVLDGAVKPSRIDRQLTAAKAGTANVMQEVEKINAAWRALPEEEKQRRLTGRPLPDIEYDRRRDLDERGISAAEAWSDEHPLQSSATSRRY
jgi:hypothetical protein